MKILATSDIHFHPFPAFATPGPDGVNSRLRHTYNRVQDMFKAAKDNGCAAIVFAGDLFHTKKIDAETIDLAVKAFRDSPVPIIGVPGNHDMATFGGDARHSARAVSSIKWLDNEGGRLVDDKGLRVYGIPYVRTKEELKVEIDKAPKCDILLMHAGFAGTKMGSDYIADLGDCADPEWVFQKRFGLVVSGHFHQPQVIEKKGDGEYDTAYPSLYGPTGQKVNYHAGETILVPGSPEQHNWGDVDSAHGYWVIDTEEHMLYFYHLKSPVFVEVKTAKDIERAKGNYVRIVQDAPIPLKELEKMRKETAGLTVEFEHEVAAKPNRGYEVSASDRPEAVMQKYVDANDTKLDKNKLMAMGRGFIGCA